MFIQKIALQHFEKGHYMSSNKEAILGILRLKGLSFAVKGPFLVCDLTDKPGTFKRIAVADHGMESVAMHQKTESHAHDFSSLYKSHRLNIRSGDSQYQLPDQCIVLILPGLQHSWIPKTGGGEVGSLDKQHARQIMVNA